MLSGLLTYHPVNTPIRLLSQCHQKNPELQFLVCENSDPSLLTVYYIDTNGLAHQFDVHEHPGNNGSVEKLIIDLLMTMPHDLSHCPYHPNQPDKITQWYRDIIKKHQAVLDPAEVITAIKQVAAGKRGSFWKRLMPVTPRATRHQTTPSV
ncbi:MAG: hypothetical protein ACD_70C00044G0001 [uncultured bacterium]|nr:MAG: hypothetical protein ACD_70C00044G0001 [uncultured bacterium]OGT86207.1 MAG: hypothetical protein A3G86_06085 [Gammaproteobacteria bacterium RIFCSPLOWO2_12_FULL_42_18]